MKKHVISATLSVAMVIALLASFCIPAFADMPRYGTDKLVLIGGNEIKENILYTPSSVGLSDVLKEGTVELIGNTLTLTKAKINVVPNNDDDKNDDGIYFENYDNFTIELIGDNEITVGESYPSVYNGDDVVTEGAYYSGITAIGNDLTTFSIKNADGKDGNLNLINGGLYCYRDNTSISGCKLTINSVNSDSILCDGYAGSLSIDNSTLTASATIKKYLVNEGSSNDDSFNWIYSGIDSFGNLTINNSTVNVSGVNGIHAYDGIIDIKSGNVIANASENGAALVNDNFSFSDDKSIPNIDIILGSGMYIKTGGKIVDYNNTYFEGSYQIKAKLIAENKNNVTYDYDNNEYSGAATYVEICKADLAATDNQNSTNTSDNASIPDSVSPKAGTLISSIKDAKTPKASISSNSSSPSTGESAMIIPIVAAVAIASIGTITFVLLKKKKVK